MRMKITRRASSAAAFPAAIIFALALGLSRPAEVRAQWTQPDTSSNINSTNTGNVGIGTAAPGEKLVTYGNLLGGNVTSHTQLYSSYDSQAPPVMELGYGTATVSDTPYASLVLSKNLTGTSNLVGLLSFANRAIANGSDKRLAGIAAWSSGATNAGNLSFYTMSAGTFSERMRLSASGYLGVGTTSPAALLHVEGGSLAGIMRVSGSGGAVMGFKDAAAGANAKHYQWRSEGGVFRMSLLNDSDVTFAQQNILVANPSGYVGLGTASPAAKLHILSPDDSVAPALSVRQDNSPLYGFDVTLDTNVNGNLTFNRVNNGVSAGVLTLDRAGGNVGIGSGAQSPTHTLEVAGTINASQGITGATINATYQDVAEWVPSTQKLQAGTVVVLDTNRTNHVLASSESYDTKVAGVVSARPGITLGEGGEGKLLVATTGRVRVKVDATRAPIKVGDLLVTSDTEGVAMKSEPITVGGRKIHAPGTIIGKALEPLDKGTGEILVLLSLQ